MRDMWRTRLIRALGGYTDVPRVGVVDIDYERNEELRVMFQAPSQDEVPLRPRGLERPRSTLG